jgi:transcriptional antiterminator NusG
MTEDEIQRMLQGLPNKKESRFVFRLGDTVRIKSGPFTSFTGKVEGINQTKSLLKVMVNIFGRARPVKLRFLDVEKVRFISE